MIITPQSICNMLNEMKVKHPDFTDALLSRIPVSLDIAENSTIMCSKAKPEEWHDSPNSTSVLGFLNAFLGNESICAELDGGEVTGFKLLNDYLKDEGQAWDEYRKEISAYNKKHGTDHKPEKGPS